MKPFGARSKDGHVEAKTYTLYEYLEKINSLFPLPPKPDEMCHDDFIKKLLAPYVLEKKEVVQTSIIKVESSSSEVDEETAFRAKMYKTNRPQTAIDSQ